MDDAANPRNRWIVAPLAPREHLNAFPGVHPLLVQLLWNRQIASAPEIAEFLRPSDIAGHSPWLMAGMTEAADRLVKARTTGEMVGVFGDYDADGVTGTTLMLDLLRSLGISTCHYLPLRNTDGYGLNTLGLDQLRQAGARLIIAVDCGISGVREVEHARTLGMDVIVVDHHEVPAVRPAAVALINPHQTDCGYPFKGLCGVGLAYKFARAVLERAGQSPDDADRWLDLVAVGTIADVVPLHGENRALVLRGLAQLNRTTRPGLRALAAAAGIAEGRITSRAVGYILGPRLNAAGRLGDAAIALNLLLTESEAEARGLAEKLEQANRQRQMMTTSAVDLARAEIQRNAMGARPDLPKLLLVAHETFPVGIAGLVAGKLVEEFRRPVLVAERKDSELRGSARSIEGFHVTEALTRCHDVLERYGGHAQAAGFVVQAHRFDELRERLVAIADAEISDAAIQPSIKIDAQLHLRLFDQSIDPLVDQLEPFGCENPRPIFMSRRIQVIESTVVGETRAHLKLKLADAHTRWDAMGFGMGQRLGEVGTHVDVVYVVERNEWNGRSSVRLKLLDFMSSFGTSIARG